MKNYADINFDGTCIYLNTKIAASLIGKIILGVFNLIGWVFLISISVMIPGEELQSLILFLIIFFLFLVFILGRYTAWNLWGAEFIRINLKSISYSRTYGIIETTEKILKIKSLNVQYEKVRYYGNMEYGRLIFYDYDELNNPFEVFQTTILISKEKIDALFSKIDELFAFEDSEQKPEIIFSQN